MPNLSSAFKLILKILLLFSLMVLTLIIIMSGVGYWLYQSQLQARLPLTEEWHYTLPPNAHLNMVAKELIAQGWLNYPSAILWVGLARFQNQARRIKAGEYAIPVGTTPQQFLAILVSGKTIQYTLTLPEGWNFRQVMAAVNAHPHLIHTLTDLDNATIMAKLNQAGQFPEGRFYPDTYSFSNRTTDVTILRRAYHTMEKVLQETWQQRVNNLPFKTATEALILASLVEKETGVPEERPLIAGVFVRRLQKKMLLQTDPTVIYALGTVYNGNIRKVDLKLKNPYNTYLYPGLPPTPIAMPGRAALGAAVKPAGGESLYFVAKGNGSHYFSATYPEHECAVIEFQLKRKTAAKRCQQYPNLQIAKAEKAQVKTDLVKETAVNTKTEVSTETGVKTEIEVKTETGVKTETEVKLETEVKAETGVKTETEVNTKTGVNTETKIESKTTETVVSTSEAKKK